MGLKFAIGFFTVFNVNFKGEFSQACGNWTMFFLPFIGGFLGLFSLGFFLIVSSFLSLEFSGIIVGIVYLATYGFLHLEGLIDTVDGYYGKLSGKDPYTIMKDSHVGAMGIIWVCGFIIFKVVTIGYLLTLNGLLLFMSALILSRLSISFILSFFSVHEKSVLALILQKASKNFLMTVSTVIALSSIILFTGFSGVILIFASFFFSILIGYKIKKEIGFINGDVLGSNIELVELFLLFISLFLVTT